MIIKIGFLSRPSFLLYCLLAAGVCGPSVVGHRIRHYRVGDIKHGLTQTQGMWLLTPCAKIHTWLQWMRPM